MNIVVLGLSLSSSWGNGHATTYRSLLREVAARGHEVLFLERDVPWYAQHRDALDFEQPRLAFYQSLDELRERFAREVREADLVIVGSYVPEGIAVGDWVLEQARGVRAFYDIDTPVTLARLERGELDYLEARQIARYELYLSFTGGPTLARLERQYGSPRARALYCSVDPARYFPRSDVHLRWNLGYMGTYSPDRQPTVEALLVEPARLSGEDRFVVAGPQYPQTIDWPQNVQRIEHLAPDAHCAFYNAQRHTLNVTRADMIAAGWSPSVRLFEAAACGTPIISDWWPGLDQLFAPGSEIVIARESAEVLAALREADDDARRAMGERARRRVLAEHTAAHRAQQLEQYALEAAAHGAAARTGMPALRSS